MKPLVDPLLWFLILQFAGLIVLFPVYRVGGRLARAAWSVVLISTAGLAILSIPVASRAIERTVTVDAEAADAESPEYIFVLASGYIPGPIPDEDVLVTDNGRRLLSAVSLWHRFPRAKLVLAGASGQYAERPAERMAQLMAEVAISRGVPRESIVVEGRSRNTREHAIEAIKLPGIMSDTPIVLVTSAYHIRRARREFERYFSDVRVHPVETPVTRWGWTHLIPSSESLEASTRYLREWFGLAWYWLISLAGPTSA